MNFEKNIKFTLTILLLLAILIYHFLGLVPINNFNNLFGISSNSSSVFDIVRILLSLFFFIGTSSLTIVSKILNGSNFIGGSYVGKIKLAENNEKHINFKIGQTLMSPV